MMHGRHKSSGSGPVKSVFVSDTDVGAVIRRLDMDGDDEVSFSDYFTAMLPYFIYGDMQKRRNANNARAKTIIGAKVNKARSKSSASNYKRPASACAGPRPKAS